MSERKKRDELRIRNFELRILDCRMGGRNGVNGVRRQTHISYRIIHFRQNHKSFQQITCIHLKKFVYL